MSIYTHHGWGGFVPICGADRWQEKIEATQQQEDLQNAEWCDFGEADEAAARVAIWYARNREVDLGGILAQADRAGDGGRA